MFFYDWYVGLNNVIYDCIAILALGCAITCLLLILHRSALHRLHLVYADGSRRYCQFAAI
uniref:ORF5a protein n=1 Tax=Equine arteritis virus TaxID=11047 RepID=A0A455LI54_EAV|nr:ORF5a protein [Cloning vector pEAVsVBSmCherry]AYF58848.1 ORF5a protein [Equine arteritis virus]AYF59018.1 ORF5a protein [Equine arteritis virus]